MKRVLLAGLNQETNSFVPGSTGLDKFERRGIVEGEAVLTAQRGPGSEIDGVIQVAREAGVELIPTIDAYAGSGPPLAASAYQYLRERILSGARRYGRELDGVMLNLHGAMLVENLEDPEGDLLAAVREVVGPSVPIVASFDLHAYVTDLIVRSADGIVGYHTCPHIDYVDTGVRAMRLLTKALLGEAKPVVVRRKLPMVTSSEKHDTNHPPMRDVMRRLLEIEKEPGILAATIFATQPWIDVTDLGWSVVVVADGDRGLAQARADEVAKMAWARREKYRVHKTPIEVAIKKACASDERPFVLSDCADSVTAGSLGDGNLLLRALLDMGYQESALITITDPEAVAKCFAAGVGGDVTTTVGGKLNPRFYQPVQVTGRVKTLTDGKYMSKYPPSPWDLGRTAVLEIGEIRLVLSEQPAPMLDQEVYHSVELDPQQAKIVQVKSAGSYRAFYEPIAAGVFDLDTPGSAGSDLTKLPFRKPRRPLWPFDADLEKPWSID